MTDTESDITRALATGAETDTRQLDPNASEAMSIPTRGESRSLGRYVVIDELGRGGMGLVLRAYNPKLQREVAIKVLRSRALGPTSEARMVHEARAIDLRMACLYRAKVGLSAVVEQLSQADKKTVANALRVVSGLPSVRQCAEIELLRVEVPPPEPAVQEAVDTLRAEVARAQARYAAGHYSEVLEIMPDLEEAAKKTGHAPLIVSALDWLDGQPAVWVEGYAFVRAGSLVVDRAPRRHLFDLELAPVDPVAPVMSRLAQLRRDARPRVGEYCCDAWMYGSFRRCRVPRRRRCPKSYAVSVDARS